jgi:predicted alpha/beta-fold hydrolase
MKPFRPPAWLANRHLQSILPSLPIRRLSVERRARPLIGASKPIVLDCGDGVRLMGWHAEPRASAVGEPPRLAVLLHGWEGSADSLYLLSLAQLLHERGLSVIRLNLRDHGGTHALNRELFHSCRLPEVVGAVARVQALFPDHRLLLAGYSLGGNFCLRVGARAPAAGIRIARIVAVCPVLDPATTLSALEHGPAVYRNYFLYKWRRSLRLKQAAWPGHYDFGDLVRDPSLTGMTEKMVLRYTDYPDLATYLNGYAITGRVLETLEAPAHLLTSGDDPMILTRDLAQVARPASLEVTVTPYGGHCGYMEALGGPSWVDRRIADELAAA